MLARSAALVVLLALGGVGTRAPQTPTAPPAPSSVSSARSPRNASYVINARLDPASRTLRGEALLCRGMHVQMVYVNRATRLVGGKLSAWLAP